MSFFVTRCHWSVDTVFSHSRKELQVLIPSLTKHDNNDRKFWASLFDKKLKPVVGQSNYDEKELVAQLNKGMGKGYPIEIIKPGQKKT